MRLNIKVLRLSTSSRHRHRNCHYYFFIHSPFRALLVFCRKPNDYSRLCVSVVISVFLVLFLSSGGSETANNENLRSGQAHHATVGEVSAQGASKTATAGNPYASEGVESVIMDEENLQEAMDKATEDINEAENVQLHKEEAMLDKGTKGVTNMIRIGLGKLFGSTLTNEEVEQVAAQVEGDLMTEANMNLRTRADAIATKELNNIEGLVEHEQDAGYETDKIGRDVYVRESGAVDAVKENIDAAAIAIKDSMKSRAAEIEKTILEERLSKKLGKRVKLVIMNDEIQGFDELFEGLGTLAPPTATTKTTSQKFLETAAYSTNTNSFVSATGRAEPTTTTKPGTSPLSDNDVVPSKNEDEDGDW